jgi:hypothetical protein
MGCVQASAIANTLPEPSTREMQHGSLSHSEAEMQKRGEISIGLH